MDQIFLDASYSNKYFRIEEDIPEVGYYLYVFDSNGNCIADHLQDDLETILSFAEDEYGIDKKLWKKHK